MIPNREQAAYDAGFRRAWDSQQIEIEGLHRLVSDMTQLNSLREARLAEAEELLRVVVNQNCSVNRAGLYEAINTFLKND